MEDRLDPAEIAACEHLVKRRGINVICNAQIRQIAKLVALRQIVNGDDVIDAARIEPLDEVAADKTGGAGDNDAGHANNSS